MASVTIPGTGDSLIVEQFSSGASLALARQIAATLLGASVGGTLNVTAASSTNVPPPPAIPGKSVNELVINAGGDYTIPAATGGAPPWVVVLNSTDPVTIHGSQNTSILGGRGPVTISDPSAIALAEGAGDAKATIAGAGDVLAGNSHNDTLVGTGADQSIFGGTGSNLIISSGAAATVSASGVNDTIEGGGAGSTYSFGSASGAQFINTGGTGRVFAGTGAATIFGAFGAPVGSAVIFGSTGSLFVATGSSSDTIFGGTSAGQSVFGGFDAVAANNGNSLIFSGANGMFIDAAGSSDTIHAGSGDDTVLFGNGTIAGSNNAVFGGSGNLFAQFVGGSGSATIFGGAGTSTVFGNAGSNIAFQGAQTGVTMVALGPTGAANSATLNAGVSSTSNFLNALSGSDSVIGGSGDDTIVAGVTGADASTLTGGAGNNLFFFRFGEVNGTDIITDLTASAGNLVALANYDALSGGAPGSAAQAALAGATTTNGNTSITLVDGTKITFDNTTVAQLQQHIFSS